MRWIDMLWLFPPSGWQDHCPILLGQSVHPSPSDEGNDAVIFTSFGRWDGCCIQSIYRGEMRSEKETMGHDRSWERGEAQNADDWDSKMEPHLPPMIPTAT